MRARSIIPLLLTLPFPLAAQDGVARAAASITPRDIATRIGVIADDSMRGRDTPSPELDEVARYIGDAFRSFGLAPGGDHGTFLQRYPLERTQLDTVASRLVVRGGPTLRFGPDLVRLRGDYPAASLTGPAVFVSGGPLASEDAAALGLAGKMVLLAVPAEGTGQPTREGQQLMRSVWLQRPAAVIVVVDAPSEVWAELGRGQMSESPLRAPWQTDGRAPVIEAREQALGPALRAAGIDLTAARAASGALRATPLPRLGLTLTLVGRATQTRHAPNVVGILEGSDPALKHEYVVFSAHMDHVGTAGAGRCRAQGADSICNGADDDASGTIAVVEAAQAFARLQPRPKRSLIFLTVSGEEHGLWGSDYFAGHPPVPIAGIVADLNMDMVGRNWRDTIVVIGKEHSDLGATLNQVNARHPELDMTAIDDIWPRENFYYRSDHYNFARRGVPILFFFNGTHADYHRPSDEPDKIDAEKESRIVKLVFYLGLEVANAQAKPKWNPESYRTIVEDGGRSRR